jgi:hypothetical protein
MAGKTLNRLKVALITRLFGQARAPLAAVALDRGAAERSF